MNPLRGLLLLTLTGCALSINEVPYYGNRWDPPVVTGLSDTSEVGNVGGQRVEISGSGFGEEATEISVLFGNHNAEILEVSDTRIEVVVPGGPITGGPVEVRVLTGSGYGVSPEPYLYDVGSVYDNQSIYVQVNNFWESCYGGLSSRLDDEYRSLTDLQCDTLAYLGYSGITGVATGYGFAYPRAHTEYIGFFGGTDQGGPEWVIERPGQISFTFGVEDLWEDIGPVYLHNPWWSEELEGQTGYCADVDSLAAYRYGGSAEFDPYSVTSAGFAAGAEATDQEAAACEAIQADGGMEADCECEDGSRLYWLDRMEFCTMPDADGVANGVYEADWAPNQNFFAAARRNLRAVDITLEAPGLGLTEGLEVPLALPESLVVYNDEGFTPITTDYETAGDLWSLLPMEWCFDDDGNGERADDNALRFSWTPSNVELTSAGTGGVVEANTYVRVTLTSLVLNWFGTTAYPARATIVVPDDHEFSNRTGFSHVDIPAEVMWQLPTVQAPESSGRSTSDYLPSTVADFGYLILTFERITDYRVQTPDGRDLVFSYSTGDFGFFDWTNPVDADGCHNCLDDDGDGWLDLADPDCINAGTEETGFGDTDCNNGRDDDGDRVEDADDPECEDAGDGDESNCDDRTDNDRDGYVDDEDPECQDGGYERDNDDPCENGDDDDGDGWVDDADPDCAASGGELGYGATECNDGLDNDEDGTIDAQDPECAEASGTNEWAPTSGDTGDTGDDTGGSKTSPE